MNNYLDPQSRWTGRFSFSKDKRRLCTWLYFCFLFGKADLAEHSDTWHTLRHILFVVISDIVTYFLIMWYTEAAFSVLRSEDELFVWDDAGVRSECVIWWQCLFWMCDLMMAPVLIVWRNDGTRSDNLTWWWRPFWLFDVMMAPVLTVWRDGDARSDCVIWWMCPYWLRNVLMVPVLTVMRW